MSDNNYNATTPPRSVAEKRQRAYERIGEYLDSLPKCSVPNYGPAEQAEHERAQRRILELCASAEDRRALCEFLIGFTGFIGDLKARFVYREADGKFYLLPTESAESAPADPMN